MIRIHVTTAAFGVPPSTTRHANVLNIGEYQISFRHYDDDNSASRSGALHPRLKAKIPKMLEWMNVKSDYFVWCDAAISFRSFEAIVDMIIGMRDKDFGLFRHRERSTIRQEWDYMQAQMLEGNNYLVKRYSGERLEEQVNHYLSDTTFQDDCLFELGCFAYANSVVANADFNMMKEWFFHNCFWSVQDQLSLPYLLQKFSHSVHLYEGNVVNNPYVSHRMFPQPSNSLMSGD